MKACADRHSRDAAACAARYSAVDRSLLSSGQGQDALHGLAMHPKFAQNHLVYVSYPKNGPKGNTLAVSRGLAEELTARTSLPDLPATSISLCEAGPGRRPSATFVYKVAAEVGRLGDNVAELRRWHRFVDLQRLVKFVVLDRSGGKLKYDCPAVRRKIDISATTIRKRVASGQSIRYLVPQAVEEIICREKLYREQAK